MAFHYPLRECVSLLHRHRIPDLLFRTACFLGAAVQLLSGLLLGLPNQG
jgi:hypothetical protein